MNESRHFRDIEVVESNDAFETVDAIREDISYIDHVRISKKFDGDSISRVAIQGFKNEEDPHPTFGIQLTANADRISRLITALELILPDLE